MSANRCFQLLLHCVLLTCITLSSASSRVWKPTPHALARDYASIQDNRGKGEIIVLMWFVPQMVEPGATGAAALTATLQKYVVIVVVHGRLDPTSGAMSFDEIDALEASDRNEKPLTPVRRDTLPPATTGMLVAMETLFRQSFGAMGKGMKMFIFEAGTINSCKKGLLSVPFDGETYTWETPIPGCTQN